MDDIYNHLEDYEDVGAVNRFKAENSELKHKLEDCNRTIQNLQNEFDKLEAEFKQLQKNYSSLLKTSRTEIQRKTEMITNLNIEKDLLVIKALQNGPPHAVQQLIRNVRGQKKRKIKVRNKVGAPDLREQIIRKSSCPESPSASSTATENSNKMPGNESVTDKKELIRRNSSRPASPSTSSTATDNSNRMSGNDSIIDKKELIRRNSSRPASPSTSSTAADKTNKMPENDSIIDKKELIRRKSSRPASPSTSSTAADNSNKMPRNDSVIDKKELIRRKTSRPASPSTSFTAIDNSNKMPGNEIVTDKKELIRRESSRPASPTTSSNAFDNSNKMLGCGSVVDKNKPSRMVNQVSELQKHEVFTDSRPSTSVADKRISALSRHQLGKLSSDEEFEDMYSDLKPKTSNEPDRNRKRGRDDSQDGKVYSLHDKPYTDPLRERFFKNKGGKFSDSERNLHRENQHNESNRFSKRGKHLNDRYKNNWDSHYQRFSPDRHRRGAKEFSDDRHRNRRLESPTRERQHLGSPPREKYQFKKLRERRKSYHGRETEHQELDGQMYNFPETTIHGAYEEPRNKRPKLEPYHTDVHQEQKRQSEKQYYKESYPPKMGNHTSPSPVFSHTEESSNEPDTALTDARSTASPVFEDPRRNSKLYVKCTEGHRGILQSANANEIYLQPVDKSLWNLQNVEDPKELAKPAEISEEHVDKIDIDKPSSIASLESGELGSETSDTALADIYDFQEFNKQNTNNNALNKNESQKSETKLNSGKSPVYERMPNEIRNKRGALKNESNTKTQKLKRVGKANNSRTGDTSTPTSKDIHKEDTNTHSNKTQLPSILHKLINSMNEIRPERENIVKLSNCEGLKEPKRITESKIPSKTEKAGSKMSDDLGGKNVLQTNIMDKHERGTRYIKEKETKRSDDSKISNKAEKLSSKTVDQIKFKNKSGLKNTDNHKKANENSKESDVKGIVESRISGMNEKSSTDAIKKNQTKNVSELKNHREKVTEKNTEMEPNRAAESNISDRNEKTRLKTNVIGNKYLSVLKKIDNPDKATEQEKEPKRNTESRLMDRNEKTKSKTIETEYKNASELTKERSEIETENNKMFRKFEYKVYSRHIIEGDLELSDESNDETQLKTEEKITISSIRKPNRETSKDKKIVSEDTTRKTRSQKDKEKERKSINKLSELFGDSSSLITPEDLNLATRTAHGLPADCCPPAFEETQDAIIEPEIPQKNQTIVTAYCKSDLKDNLGESTIVEGKNKTKEHSRTRTQYKQDRDVERNLVSIDTPKDFGEDVLGGVSTTANFALSEAEDSLVLLIDKEMQKAKVCTEITENDLDLNEKPKESSQGTKRPKTKGEKKLSVSELTAEINIDKFKNTESNSNNKLTMSENKENASYNGNSERDISNEMAKIFENAIGPSVVSSSDVSEVNKERSQLEESTKDTNCITAIPDVPNLAPVVEEPGLVKMVVISTGIQPLDSNSTQFATPFNALASSTPAKDLSAINISSEMEPKVNHSAQVSVTITKESSVSQSDADVPDMRITCYRRRRKVLKKV